MIITLFSDEETEAKTESLAQGHTAFKERAPNLEVGEKSTPHVPHSKARLWALHCSLVSVLKDIHTA